MFPFWGKHHINGVQFPQFKVQFKVEYPNDPKFSDRYAWANSADPDQTAPL